MSEELIVEKKKKPTFKYYVPLNDTNPVQFSIYDTKREVLAALKAMTHGSVECVIRGKIMPVHTKQSLAI